MNAPRLRPEALAETQVPLTPSVENSRAGDPAAAGGSARLSGAGAMLREGEVLGTYQVEHLIGRGGMGEVYAARHVRLGRRAALKVLRTMYSSREEVVARFFQEARAVNSVNHEHIVEIYDFVEERVADRPPRVYLVMELLSGRSLGAEHEAAPMKVERIARVMAQVADALEAAHRVGVVHRDLKPDNVFLTERGGQPDFVKVLDFGVAKLEQEPTVATPETIEGMIIGTPAYMSPEQASGTGTDARGDIYALGTILYELLTGKLPFEAQNFVQLAMMVVSLPVPELPEHAVSGELIPPGLRALTMACLAKSPSDRPQSMAKVAELLRDQGALSSELSEAELRAAGLPPPRPGRRWGLLAASGVGAVAVAIALVAALVMPTSRPVQATSAVEPESPAPIVTVTDTNTNTAAAVEVSPEPAPEPAQMAPLRLEVLSSPSGARLLREDTGELVGVTPLSMELERAEGSTPMRLELSGHKPRAIEVPRDRDARLEVSLEAVAPPKRKGDPPPRSDPAQRDRRKELNRDAILDPYANTP